MSGPVFHADWTSQLLPVWEAFLLPMAGRPGLRFLEIGSWEGRSACWLLTRVLTHPTASLTCIDPFEIDPAFLERIVRAGHLDPLPPGFRLEERFDSNVRAVGAEGRVTKIRVPSARALRELPLDRFDFVLVDGCHEARCVLEDAVLAWPLLKREGLLCFDDYEWRYPGDDDPRLSPRLGVDAFLRTYAGAYRALHIGHAVLLRKV